MLDQLLFKRIDNGSLLVFRIFFGILVAMESFGALITGWVKRNLVAPKYTFPFIDFEWIETLSGPGMYAYFTVMGLLGLCIALGFKYRFSCFAFTLLWTGTYIMQKTAYNNHYYLLILISGIMCFFPANRDYSVDAKLNPEIRENSMYAYVKWIIVLQLFIVYVYASIAKLYGDWLDFGIIKILMRSKADYFLIGELLQQPWAHKIIGVVGILFDLFIIPALLWKPTRKIAFFISIFFHLFNSVVFQIGIFPYLSLAFSVFFFEPRTLRKLFFKGGNLFINSPNVQPPSYRKIFLIICSLYFLVQLVLPIRHFFIKDEVLWTEEGHRMSWRMMLRSRTGKGRFQVTNHTTGTKTLINVSDYLTKSQKRKVFSYPDFAWQFARYLKKDFAAKGQEISVHLLNSVICINDRPYTPFIDPNVDLANTPWKPLEHHNWILPSNL